jgi:sec-independent protein translocase protein TatC
MPRVKPVSHDEQLTLVDHLDELRSRLMWAIGAFVLAFAVCGWQNKRILEIVNAPLPAEHSEPITLGITEPFTTTFTNAAYAAILLALPVILYQLYAFVLPAFSPSEKRVAKPLLLMSPFLFIGGVVFCYFVVLPPATDFLLSFNSSEFNTEVRARDYYSFSTMTMLAMGIGFQVPIGIIALTRMGIVTVEQLRHNRRYAILGIAVLAALLPTIDPITMLLEMVPLVILYELSILLAAWLGRADEAAEADVAAPESS